MNSPPARKELGPGYDRPNRKFHFWAVILPTAILLAAAVVLMNEVGRGPVAHGDVVACPAKKCPPASPSATPSATGSKKASAASAARPASAGGRGAVVTALSHRPARPVALQLAPGIQSGPPRAD